MKKLLTVAFAIAMTTASFNTFAQSIDDVVKSHIKAIGGEDNWEKLKSMKTEMSMKAQGAEVKLSLWQVDKKALKVEINVMGMTGYQILTTADGWQFMPFQGQTKPEPMTADDVKTGQDQLWIQDEFITYKEKGKKLQDLGKDEVEGTECYKISLTDKDGKVTTYFLDASNYHTIKSISKLTANGKEVESTSLYSNYKPIEGGLVMPFNTSGDQGEMEVTSIVMNPVIDESIFKVAK